MVKLRAAFLPLLGVLASGCGDKREPKGSTPAAIPAQSDTVPVSRFSATGWPEDAGPLVVLPGGHEGDVRLVLPELTDRTMTDTSSFDLDSLPRSAVSLFSRDGKRLTTTISGDAAEESLRGCKSWPAARLETTRVGAWRVGLAAEVAEPLPVQDWGSGLVADSMQAVRDLISLASAARTDSTFQGIPPNVRYMLRLELSGARVVIADIVRRINTEANVREEHTLLIAERKEGAQHFSTAFRETQKGGEEDVRVPEVLAAFFLGENRRPSVLISVEYSDGARLLLLERRGAAQWISRWRSAYAGC
jgi:hypothetical protein